MENIYISDAFNQIKQNQEEEKIQNYEYESNEDIKERKETQNGY